MLEGLEYVGVRREEVKGGRSPFVFSSGVGVEGGRGKDKDIFVLNQGDGGDWMGSRGQGQPL